MSVLYHDINIMNSNNKFFISGKSDIHFSDINFLYLEIQANILS